jgi:hypothetical protein
MCDRNCDTADWRQYHPVLRATWHDQLTAYNPTSLYKSDEFPLYPEATSESCQHGSPANLSIAGPVAKPMIASPGQPIRK